MSYRYVAPKLRYQAYARPKKLIRNRVAYKKGPGFFQNPPPEPSSGNAMPRVFNPKSKPLYKKKRADWAGALGMIGGALAGAGVAGIPGAALGAGIGSSLGSTVGNLIGSGSYKLVSNSLVGVGQVPRMHAGKGCTSVRIRHREYIKDISSSGFTGANGTSFTSDLISINPRYTKSFPWLSSFAGNFQEYVPAGIAYEFVSTCSDSFTNNTGNLQLGTVIMATQYNCNMKRFVDKQSMDNTEYSCSGKPSKNMIHLIECDPKQRPLEIMYIGAANDSSTFDQRFAILGNFQIATEGFQAANSKIGELWATYDILLLKPLGGPNGPLLGDHYSLGSGVTTSAYFGLAPVLSDDSNLGSKLTNTTITFPNGMSSNVRVEWSAEGASTATVPMTLTGTNGATPLDVYISDADSTVAVSCTTTNQMSVSYWNIVSANDGTYPTITFSSGTLVGTQTAGDLFISTVQNAE